MSRKQALQSFNQELHISHSQIFTYLNCSLKYRFQYVENRKPERVSIALIFGSAIHSALEMYYQELKNREQAPSLEAICKRFHTYLELDLETTDIPVIYKKSTPDRASTVSMGKAMLKVFYENIVQTVQNVQEIIDVELPLKATLYTDDGQPTDFKLMGIIDLLIRDNNGELIIVDNKTVYSPMSQDMGSAYDSIDSLNLIMDSFEVVEKFSSH